LEVFEGLNLVFYLFFCWKNLGWKSSGNTTLPPPEAYAMCSVRINVQC